MRVIPNYIRNEDGAVTVEVAIISSIMIALTIAAFEICHGFFQWNNAQQSARIGARLAATHQSISNEFETLTGLEGGAQPGDPMPDYSFTCDGASTSCSAGGFNASAFKEIVFGPDDDGVCGPTEKARRGICDVYRRVGPENVEIEYRNSGLGRAGNPASPAPIITVTLKDLEFDFAVLRYFTPDSLRTMPPIRVSVMAEDMRSGA